MAVMWSWAGMGEPGLEAGGGETAVLPSGRAGRAGLKGFYRPLISAVP